MAPITVAIARVPGCEDLPLPAYATEGAAGLDLRAAVTGTLVLEAGERVAVPTGFCIALPDGFEAQTRPRSGLALRHGIGMVNAPGTIDCDYRGEIKLILINLGHLPFTIQRGDRIGQLVVAPVNRVVWEPVQALKETQRGPGGFGHTGT